MQERSQSWVQLITHLRRDTSLMGLWKSATFFLVKIFLDKNEHMTPGTCQQVPGFQIKDLIPSKSDSPSKLKESKVT